MGYRARMSRACLQGAWAVLLVAVITAMPGTSVAASFDCQKATSKIELMICASPALSAADEQLAKAYREALASPGNPEEVKVAQRDWLKQRDEVTSEPEMQKLYDDRIVQLRNYVGTHAVAQTKSIEASESSAQLGATESKSTVKKSEKDTIIILAIVLVVALCGVYFGISDKAIFYYDASDVAFSFVPLIVGFGMWFVGSAMKAESWVFAIIWIVVIGLYSAVAYKSYKHNGKFAYAFPISIAKVMLSILCVVQLLGVFGYDKKKSYGENMANRARSAFFLSLLVLLMKRLVNGERVEEQRAVEGA